MKLCSFALLSATLVVAATASGEPPRVTAKTLPGWWPAQLFGKSSVVTAEDYGEGDFNTSTVADAKRAPLRGRHWKADLLRTPDEEKQKLVPDAEVKWKALLEALTGAGFKVVNLVQRHGTSYDGVYATLQKGAGAEVTWLRVDLHQPFKTGQMEAVELASNPLVVELPAPGPTPEKVGEKDNLPYLPPPANERLVSTQHFNQPLGFRSIEPPHHEEPIGSGNVVKTYEPDPTISALAFHDAYADALKKAGWTVSPVADTTVFAHYDKNGRDLYVAVAHGRFYGVDQGTELAAALATRCTAEVYGLNFDFDKATLRPDSEPTLQQVLRVLRDEPKLQVEVGGHTDNVGARDYNATLSEKRAAAVKDWLVAHGIAAGRLSSHGYGDTRPLVPNSSDLNRAKNRRVELKKPNCQ